MSVPVAEVDLRVGGTYRITMESPDGSTYPVTGTYRVVDPPKRLVYTWCWQADADAQSLVTIDFIDKGSSTEIVLRHEAFPSADLCERHERGWNGILDRLVQEY